MKTIFFCLTLSLSLSSYGQENYLAKFHTLNPQINGIIAGSSTIYITADQIKAFVRLFAGSPETWHMQNVFIGDRCPDIQDDLNLDGFIDIQEAYKVVGDIIIPLDGDISSQKSDLYVFPVANESGSYSYEKAAKFKHFIADLKKTDKNEDDNIIKLDPYEELNLEGKVIIIQGVASDVVVPASVASYGSRKISQTLPVACGVFKRTL